MRNIIKSPKNGVYIMKNLLSIYFESHIFCQKQ
ncbi:hypothetical protein AF75_03660 [Aliarcobacter butzleri L350]|uniref:Uncharacterized protein n=1 Tax=Aliarcobacter butzleri L351 TaxID=1447259 RepID=A0A837J7V5_9BACT|nr:hypothetical protein AF76_02870 [Aliarcobacter butzleri L351]KLE13431.1 hypothetical protein AF75_03660 [Aliarcobacter butzleri L350]